MREKKKRPTPPPRQKLLRKQPLRISTQFVQNHSVAIFFACYRGHLDPSGPKSKKSPKMGSRGLAQGAEKVEKRVKNEYFDCFWTFRTLFRLFFDLFDPAPGTHFQTFVGLWAQRAQMTPVAGKEDRKHSGTDSKMMFLCVCIVSEFLSTIRQKIFT